MILGERLRKIRGGLTQAAFAKKLCVSQPTIRNYEQGTRRPDADFLNSICYNFNIAPEWLLMGTGPMFKNECSAKTADTSAVFEEKKTQHAENTNTGIKQTADMSVIFPLQRELTEAVREQNILMRENTQLIRENADLRVALEQHKGQLRDLEREKTALAQKIQGMQHDATEITDRAVVQLAHENDALKVQLARLNRLGVFDEPDTRMPQRDIQNRE